jgi:hypothetical protein
MVVRSRWAASLPAIEGAASIEVMVGDPDPLQAIEDALRAFPADELIIVTRPGSEAAWLDEERARESLAPARLPVTQLAGERP